MSGQMLMNVCIPDRFDGLTNSSRKRARMARPDLVTVMSWSGGVSSSLSLSESVSYSSSCTGISVISQTATTPTTATSQLPTYLPLRYRPLMWLRLRYDRDLQLVAYSARFLLDFQSLNVLVNLSRNITFAQEGWLEYTAGGRAPALSLVVSLRTVLCLTWWYL